MHEWHVWDPPPHDDPRRWATAPEGEVERWDLAEADRRNHMERWRQGHFPINERPYRDMVEEVLGKLAAES